MHSNVVNRHGARVTTAVTNLDIHDIARSARTYELRRYFLVTPLAEQHELVGRILGHWQSKQSREYHPDRFEALSRVRLAWNFDEVRAGVEAAHGGKRAEVVLTDASELPGKVSVSYRDYRAELTEAAKQRPMGWNRVRSSWSWHRLGIQTPFIRGRSDPDAGLRAGR